MLEHPPHERQQVEVSRVDGWVASGHAIPRDEERPVKAAAVVCHEPRVPGTVGLEQGEQCRLVRLVRQEQLGLPEPVALPPTQPDEERQRSGRRREPCRLGVEADERHVGRWLTRDASEAIAIEGQDDGQWLTPDDRVEVAPDDLAVDGLGHEARESRRPRPVGDRWAGRRPDGGPVVREPALEGRTAHAAATAPAPISPRSLRASPFASASGSSRGPVQAGQPASQPQDEISSVAPAISSS